MKLKSCNILFFVCIFSLLVSVTSQARDVTLQWDPNTEPSVTGYKIYYNVDSANLPFIGTGAAQGPSPHDVSTATTTTLNGLDSDHSYYFAVTAYDASGAESSYSNTIYLPEATPPTVSISSPAPNATLSGTVSVTASATDNVGVTNVEFYLNGVLTASDTSTPYVYSLNTTSLASGAYTLLVKAYDAAGNVGQSATVSVMVVNDTTAPSVSLASPVNNATVSGTTTITANASDNVGVNYVEFYANGSLVYVTNMAPYSYGWNTTTVNNGSYVIYAKAYDNAGNVAQSANVSVTVNNPVPDTTAPAVSVTAPANNATVSGTVLISAGASDNVGVSKVEFFVNGSLINTASAAPYTYNWDSTSIANGTYPITAKAYDAAGNVNQSAVTVTVINGVADTIAPTVSIISPSGSTTRVKLNGSVLIAVSANDNVGVTKVEFFLNGSLNKTITVAPFSYSVPATEFQSGSYNTLFAKAYDAAGNVMQSATLRFTLKIR